MREEIGLHILAKELNVDIDEIKSWPAEKILRWSIALKVMSEEMNKSVKSPESPRKYLFVFK